MVSEILFLLKEHGELGLIVIIYIFLKMLLEKAKAKVVFEFETSRFKNM